MKTRRVILLFGQTGSGKSHLAKQLMVRFPRLIIFDPNGEYNGLTVTDFDQFVRFVSVPRDSYQIICQYDDEDDYDATAQAVWILGDCCLVLEECQTFLGALEQNSIQRLITRGRHKRISIIGLSPRPTEIPPRLRSQCSTIVTFKQWEPADVQAMQAWGFDADEISSLGKFEYATLGESIEEIQTTDN